MFNYKEDPNFTIYIAFLVIVSKEQLAARRLINTLTSKTIDLV